METLISYISLAFSIGSVIFAFGTFVWTAKRDRKQATFEAFNRLQNEVFDKINLKSKIDVKNIAENPKSAEFTEYSQYLARIEQFCVGIAAKIYDYKITKKVAAKYLKDIYHKSLPVIEKKRIIYSDEPQCVEFQRIVEEMNK